ncbi:MAG TPA: two-component regulator propeller domain-containing protein [Anaerolineae bacterium]
MRTPKLRLSLIWLYISLLLPACNAFPEATATPLPPPSPEPQTAMQGPILTPAPPGIWQTYRVDDGLPYPSTTAVAAAPDGGVWVGTARGAAYFDGQRWTSYRVDDGLLSDLILSVAVDADGIAWFGTDEGVTRYDGQNWSHYTEEDGLPTGYVQVIEAGQDGKVWLGITGAGSDWAFGNGVAYIADAGTASKHDDELQLYPPTRERMAGDVVSAIADLGEAGMWFGVTPEGTVRANSGRGGLWRLTGVGTADREGGNWTVARMADGLPGDTVTALASAGNGDLWLGTTAGLARIPAEVVSVFAFEQIERFGIVDGLPGERILALAIGPDDRVWLGTDTGLAVLAGDSIETITTAEGLADNQIRSIAIATDGAVWVATPSGVSVRR